MKLQFIGKNIEVTNALKEITAKKFEKLDKFFSKDIEGKVTYSAVKNDKIFEATIYLPNSTILRAEESTNDMYTSIDIVLDNLERQIRKNKTKLQKKYQALETIRFEKIAEPLEEEESKIVRIKKFDVATMSEEEAILQMNLLGHNFFMFFNSETEAMAVVYRRDDGKYGLIDAAK